ncbi:MAG: hypothetical protein KZQ88_09350 [Candidatus Thiodiazotropha sp. (ex Dulcina madagascariensis)]|nr:hypothetical protein [Candidatus Thiodiazotropha sp. (ex Dulcina madagascariensis)]MCU7925027.1 hypothetical protein [Candidatus Thiodiazotropha sp. (ex Dulcina madagascariensis)]
MNVMKYSRRLIPALAITIALTAYSGALLSASSAHHIGFSYVSGARNVWDWHEDNLFLDDELSGVPIGLFYRFTGLFDSGFRLDAGVGPLVLIIGDVEYYDVPIQFSIGYGFFSSSSFRPYARVGASFHINDGDYLVDETNAGVIGAIGFELGEPNDSVNFFMEASYDNTEVTFSTAESNEYFARRPSQEDILASDFMLTIGARF